MEVGAPFLEQTRDRLEERATALIECRPQLAHFFDDLISPKVAFGDESRETKLAAALDAHVALLIQAERLIAAYLEPESNRPAVINDLIALFDGPPQREAQRQADEALDEAAAPSDNRLRTADPAGARTTAMRF